MLTVFAVGGWFDPCIDERLAFRPPVVIGERRSCPSVSAVFFVFGPEFQRDDDDAGCVSTNGHVPMWGVNGESGFEKETMKREVTLQKADHVRPDLMESV